MFWITGLLGLLLGLAPFVLGFAGYGVALWVNLILGVLILVISAVALSTNWPESRWPQWLLAVGGLVAVVAPFIFGYSGVSAALWTDVVLGVLLMVIGGAYAMRAQPTARAG